MQYVAKTFNLGFIADCHGQVDKLDIIISTNPKVEKWFFLGDLLCFRNPKNNTVAARWLLENKDKVLFIKGNHDHVCAQRLLNLSFADAWDILGYLYNEIEIVLPDSSELKLVHSKPKDFWVFIEQNYTERQFLDEFDGHEDYKAFIIGHNHKQFKLSFPYTNAEIWSIGASCFGKYAILDKDGIKFKSINT